MCYLTLSNIDNPYLSSFFGVYLFNLHCLLLSLHTIYFSSVTNIVNCDLFGLDVNVVNDPIVPRPNAIKSFSAR